MKVIHVKTDGIICHDDIHAQIHEHTYPPIIYDEINANHACKSYDGQDIAYDHVDILNRIISAKFIFPTQ
jgi:hypothetical protein